ncbi:MAG: hypothetical protein J6A23_10620 [Thermoguttaceae bacterium]|nr:hypothetical protein [Thermoguttaceae bacterium]
MKEKKTDHVVPLKNAAFAAFLAWFLPGLGHLYQGRKAKAAIYAVCILGLFFFGALLASGKCGVARCVYISMSPGPGAGVRYYYFAQVWAGAPALPALVQYLNDPTGVKQAANGFMAPPIQVTPGSRGYSENEPSIDNIRKKLNRRFEIGTLMTTMAGLLNIFAIFDALYGPVNEEEEERNRQKKLEEKRKRQRAKRRKGEDAAEM